MPSDSYLQTPAEEARKRDKMTVADFIDNFQVRKISV